MAEEKTKRKAISKTVRFEVFKRDSFKCQYCGESSPEVVLEVDHIHPVSKGGENDILNLITSCRSCNAGKSDRTLDDSSAVQKQRKQLEELSERREQLEMLLQWREGLESLDEYAASQLVERINREMGDAAKLNETGEASVSKWLKKYSVTELLDAIDTASARRDIKTKDDAEYFFGLIPKIAAMSRKPEAERRLYYVRGILRNRMYVNEAQVMGMLREALEGCGDIEWIVETAKSARNWTEFRTAMHEAANG